MVSCGSTLAAISHGVSEDQVRVIRSREAGNPAGARNISDGNQMVLNEIRESRGPNYELLNIGYGAVRCDSERMTIPFTGATIRQHANGPARPMDGQLIVETSGSITVNLAHI
jgi:hypothetical protein